jgi:hypothetical protein
VAAESTSTGADMIASLDEFVTDPSIHPSEAHSLHQYQLLRETRTPLRG